ncbi:hypothetical protein STSP2_01415 [Anaerohalosphaera lusitana]|uniref:Uncharacterized protein n=1 Tax=Anaerohalosphaera lusitana TaxID=1936003 RepID=A0A1U9NK24_9BACT|nr:hypothetical protein [Anaerohalosphaera lusitana]AQT68259.1 hypothetical protein STSP2_01415 [Anaerohalosphaera lusitana]
MNDDVVFEDMFRSTLGQPINYKDKTLVLVDSMSVNDGEHIRIVFETTDSEWKQGISLVIEDGSIVVAGKEVKDKRGIGLWEDTAPKAVELVTKTGKKPISRLNIHNVWHNGRFIDYGHNGAAMWVEEIPNGRRYHCNDGHPDDDLNDLVFRIERMT